MGIAKVSIKYSMVASLTGKNPGFHPLTLINVLAALPSGSTVIAMGEVESNGLSRDFELLVENDLFTEDAETIEVIYNRDVGFNHKGELIQFIKPGGLDFKKSIRRTSPVPLTPMTPDQEAITKDMVDRASALNMEEIEKIREAIRLGSFRADDNGK